jgi:hypothetical protein
MYWTIHCVDKPNAASLRQEILKTHLSYVATAKLRIVLAGPLSKDIDGSPSGSLLVVEADERSEVENFAKGAPFASAGLWESVRIDAFTPVTIAFGG